MIDTTETENTFVPSNGRFNRAALRRHAIKVSNQIRGGKFTRVSEEFLNQIEASAESVIRKMRADVGSSVFGQVEPGDENFLTGVGKEHLAEQFNIWIAREIHRQSNNVRTGKTL